MIRREAEHAKISTFLEEASGGAQISECMSVPNQAEHINAPSVERFLVRRGALRETRELTWETDHSSARCVQRLSQVSPASLCTSKSTKARSCTSVQCARRALVARGRSSYMKNCMQRGNCISVLGVPKVSLTAPASLPMSEFTGERNPTNVRSAERVSVRRGH